MFYFNIKKQMKAVTCVEDVGKERRMENKVARGRTAAHVRCHSVLFYIGLILEPLCITHRPSPKTERNFENRYAKVSLLIKSPKT